MAIKTFKDYPNTTTPILAEDLNEISNSVLTGWNSAGETWTYSSVDDPTGVITISGDVTIKYSLGMRIKFTNGGNTIYGIITKLAYSSPNTTLTFLHEIDPTDSLAKYLMTNSVITNNYYSIQKAPFGFPINEDKWSIIASDANDRQKTSLSVNTWYYSDLGSINLSVPIGHWRIYYNLYAAPIGSGGDTNQFVALSTSTTSVSDNKLRSRIGTVGVTDVSSTLTKETTITLTSKTIYYLIASTSSASTTTLRFLGSFVSPTIIKATCLYL